jgi:hypothetical protein
MELILVPVLGVLLGLFLPDRKIARRCGGGAALGLVSLLVVAAVPTAEASILTESLPPLPVDVAAALEPAAPFLEESSGSLPALPANPTATLIESLRSLSSDMGVPRDPTGPVLEAGLPPEVAGSIALLTQEALACERITKAHMAAMPPSVLKDPAKEYGRALNPSDFNDIRHCARKLWKSTNDLEKALTGAIPSTGADLDFWPVLRYSPSTTNDTYVNDYAITIDAGGDDTYVNNVGSNVIDVNFGPHGQPGILGEGPAKGCQRAIAGITGPPPHCIPAVGVLVDLAGNDRHGVKQAPDVDAQCTADPVVRRMLTNGTGFLGVGVLVDRGGNDHYTAKTASNGTGHLFGVGILHDKAGNDRYLDVRNSTGFALFGGLGVFRDYAGDDRHDFYMPGPLKPDAPNQTPGAGGVIDDEDACDNLPRYNVGVANVGGVGVAIDDAGNDTYRGGFTPDFLAPGGTGRGGSQGFGNNGASGVLLDRAGVDAYTIVGGDQGSPARHNGVTILPGADSTGTGAFRDV